MLLFYLIIIIMIIELWFKTKKSLHMLQQNLYNENNRYIKWIIKNLNNFMNAEVLSLIFILIGYFVIFDLDSYVLADLIFILLLYSAIATSWQRKLASEQTKKPLVVTKRIKRLLVTITIIYLIPLLCFVMQNNSINFKSSWLYLLIFSLLVYFNSIIVFLANVINFPIERMVYNHYKTMAQQKLRSMPGLKIIGITGSYGKTSSKNILAEILNIKYNALPTPRNLNTYNGLIMTINNNMDKFTDIFIAEMGAYVKGEIKGLCDLVSPQYGILTRIGTAHLESFGSEENIQKGKFELIESLPEDGVGVLNGDDPKQIEYDLKKNVEIIWIGIENKDVDIRAENIKCSNKGTTFDVIFKGDKKKYPFTTKLLGSHNVYNILSSLALGRKFGIEMKELQTAVKGVKPVEHRLELKRLGSFYMIDDAYNSNPVGAKSALDVLEMMPGIKIVVTPGMIELGEKEDMLNEEFGKNISKVADYVILIGKEKTKPILKGLKSKNYKEENIIVYNDVRASYDFINEITKKTKEEVYALFENDLPDTYNE